MRDKQKFIDDFNKVIKEEFKNEIDPVQDAAHILDHSEDLVYTLPKEWSKTAQDEKFKFEKKYRVKTDVEPEVGEAVEDYFYIGKE